MAQGLWMAVAAAASALIAAPAAAEPAGSSTEISVLTYNVHGLPWPLSPGRTKDLKAIGDTLEQLRAAHRQPDIVLIQEGFTGEMKDLIRRSGYRYWARGPGRHDRVPAPADQPRHTVRYVQTGEGWGKFASAGLYVLSDYPVTAVESQPYTDCAGWDCLANKGVMLAHVAVSGVPGGIDVVNTHLNSLHAARVPERWSLKAYDQQVSELAAFVSRNRDPDTPLLVGGDFNVRHAPDRYSQVVGTKAFAVVSQYCLEGGAGCAADGGSAGSSPWLESQDLQAFANVGPVAVQPIGTQMLFDNTATPRLSDHDGYVVRYRLTWPDAAGKPG